LNKNVYIFKERHFQFKIVEDVLIFKNIDISFLEIETLYELPWSKERYRVIKSFNCSNNLLKDLGGGPFNVRRLYDCSFNNLRTLNGSPSIVNYFDCSSNKDLCTLENGPIKAYNYICENCGLITLRGSPRKVNYFNCSENKDLETLEDGPEIVNIFKYLNCIKISKNMNYKPITTYFIG
jgi:hypothetical protein